MSWFGFGKSAPRVADMSAQARLPSRPILETGFRRGMWVVWEQNGGVSVGVLLEIGIDGTALVNSARPDGTNLLTGLRIPVGELRQATFDQIPNGRKPRNTDKDYGRKRDAFARMGYV